MGLGISDVLEPREGKSLCIGCFCSSSGICPSQVGSHKKLLRTASEGQDARAWLEAKNISSPQGFLKCFGTNSPP